MLLDTLAYEKMWFKFKKGSSNLTCFVSFYYCSLIWSLSSERHFQTSTPSTNVVQGVKAMVEKPKELVCQSCHDSKATSIIPNAQVFVLREKKKEFRFGISSVRCKRELKEKGVTFVQPPLPTETHTHVAQGVSGGSLLSIPVVLTQGLFVSFFSLLHFISFLAERPPLQA